MKVVIIQRVLPHYRIPFFVRLKQLLEQEAIELYLVYGQEFPGSTPRTVEFNEPWAIKIHNRYLKLPFAELTWQPCWHYAHDADLVIVEQANRLLVNYLLQFLWRNRSHKLVFWGHGTNFQSRRQDSFKNSLRRFFSRHADWWLAYTDLSGVYLKASHFPADKLTVVQNCIDTENLKRAVQGTSDQDLRALRRRLCLTSQHIGLYCGGLYPDKRIDFLLAACDRLKAKVPDFECLIIGEGPDSELVRSAAESRPWLHYLGAIFGDERVPYFLLSKVLLMPGLVGLVIIDSFVTRLSLFTTDNGIHSPEIAYLENGVNGFMSADNLDDYVNEVTKALNDDAYLQSLRNGCARSANKYSLDNMAHNFVAGIRQCLSDKPAITANKRVVIVTNIPAPYRMPIYERLAKLFGYDDFHVIYCAAKEDNREWIINRSDFAYTVLNQNYISLKGRYIHFNPDVLTVLRKLKPDVIITTGFNPTHLLAFAYALLRGKVHIPMTDGTLESEQKLSRLHRIVRRIVYLFSKVAIGASLGSLRLYQSYGIKPMHFYQSHLCADNTAFAPFLSGTRDFDVMFSGRFAPEKNPLFVLDIAAGVAKALGRKVRVLMLGSGPLLDQAKEYAETLKPEVETCFPGFMQQAELPGLYCSAKLFLFPSSWDPWGVVANEACAAGQAVMVSPHAGVADELVCHGENGYVLPLDLALWIEHAAKLLADEKLLKQFSDCSVSKVQAYNYDAAAQGVVDGVLAAMGGSNQ